MDENKEVAERTDQTHRPPRLSVVLASEAPVGVLLRRGPTKVVRVVIWDRAKDKFKPGPWFTGRICPERSDISPDGPAHDLLRDGRSGMGYPCDAGNVDCDFRTAVIESGCALGTRRHVGRRRNVHFQRFLLA
jgi:hypothetical protein